MLHQGTINIRMTDIFLSLPYTAPFFMTFIQTGNCSFRAFVQLIDPLVLKHGSEAFIFDCGDIHRRLEVIA
jgi:hypothetical protein